MTRKTVVITGSTRGIGRAAAGVLLSRGYDVIIHGSSQETSSAAAEQLNNQFGVSSAIPFGADFSRLEGVCSLFEFLCSYKGDVVAIVNNAASIHARSDLMYKRGPNDSRMWVNAVSPFFLTSLALRMAPSVKRIVNVSIDSEVYLDSRVASGDRRLRGSAPYYYSKALMSAWSYWVGGKMKGQGVDVLTAVPGYLVDTELSRAVSDELVESPEEPGLFIAEASVSDSLNGLGGAFYQRWWHHSGEVIKEICEPPPGVTEEGVGAGVASFMRETIEAEGFGSCSF